MRDAILMFVIGLLLIYIATDCYLDAKAENHITDLLSRVGQLEQQVKR